MNKMKIIMIQIENIIMKKFEIRVINNHLSYEKNK